MRNLSGLGLFVCVFSVWFVALVTGSAWLQDPPSRSAAWYYQIKAPVNYNFRNLDCGGNPVVINSDGTRNCGLCGDDYNIQTPRPNELGGKYASPIIRTRYYEAGQKAEISIWNNLPGSPGFYEFRLCEDALNPSQECLNRNLLTILDNNKTNMKVPNTQGFSMIHLQLPAGVTCEYCLLQWRFRKENSVVGCDGNNWCGMGRGPQMEYYNCADVTIGQVGQPKPNYIQDPVYSSADYGSAYDVATTLTTQNGGRTQTTPSSGGLNDNTRPTQVPFFTIPTLPPAFPTQSPAVTTPPAGQVTERLVVDGSGNQIGTVLSGTSGVSASSSNNNRQLLLLLGLLPLIGAVALRNGNRIPPAAVPPGSPGFLAAGPPVSEYFLGSGIGFGNFGPGAFPGAAGGVVGSPFGFTPGFAPGRFGRSVEDGESDTAGEIEPITHVHPRSVEEMDIEETVESNTTNGVDDEKPQVRLQRSAGGNEYGHADNEYGNSNKQVGQWQTANGNQGRQFGNQGNNVRNQGRNRAFMSTGGASGFPTQSSTGVRQGFQNRNVNIDGGGNTRNRQGRFGQNPSEIKNKVGGMLRQRFRSAMSQDTMDPDLAGLLRVTDVDRGFLGFRANANPLARTLSRGKRPSVHDWYTTFMTRSTNPVQVSQGK